MSRLAHVPYFLDSIYIDQKYADCQNYFAFVCTSFIINKLRLDCKSGRSRLTVSTAKFVIDLVSYAFQYFVYVFLTDILDFFVIIKIRWHINFLAVFNACASIDL